ncbi:hypothetical protein F4810DRAFT_685764 [Camillea tinctor]|nr:hypothetical protein F4810DRAFT_685764 [Camillea tinctor]
MLTKLLAREGGALNIITLACYTTSLNQLSYNYHTKTFISSRTYISTTIMSVDGHGLPDPAIKGAHDMIHHAEQEEHEHEAAMKRGLPDSAAEAEYDLIHGAEERQEQYEKKHESKVKKALEKLIPGKH